MINVRVKQTDWERGRCKVARENSFTYEGLLWVLLFGNNESELNPVVFYLPDLSLPDYWDSIETYAKFTLDIADLIGTRNRVSEASGTQARLEWPIN